MGMEIALEGAFVAVIAGEIGCRPAQVEAAAALFAEGATVPFVARYRKEATGGLDDGQLESLFKRRSYFLELAARRDAILASIAEQGKLTPELETAIRSTLAKQELEDLYLPYRPKRRTRAQIARERGLEPLADALLEAASGTSAAADVAAPFVQPELGVQDAAAALGGARDILAERLSETAELRSALRRTLALEGIFKVQVLPGKETAEEAAVYRDYFAYSERARDAKSHRLLAILRSEREGFLISDLSIPDEPEVERLARWFGVPLDTPCGREVAAAAADGYKRLLRPSLTNEVRSELRERAEAEAIAVFRVNLEALLLQPPLGQVPVIGLDPGLRTGCKLALVDGTGRVLATEVLRPLPPHSDVAGSARALVGLIARHGVKAVAIGNGTAGRETERFARTAIEEAGISGVTVAIVPETGASIYSASGVAREELPDLDVSLRGAVSIARRLQDPLAELVKIEPRSLGVGQYQHDVDQRALETELDAAVEGAVNRVGVELNTASAPLLRRVSGLSERIARSIVSYRDAQGAFPSRRKLLEVAGFGAKTFELAAGFLRIREGSHPLDRTAVHPERYPVVERMAKELGVPLTELVGNPHMAAKVEIARFLDASSGLGTFTLADIQTELARPGRDPRPEFSVPEWRADVTSIDDLVTGMVLEGRVSNVTNFGAFVDVGIKRDGLVHVSELSHRFIADPREAVKVGDVVKAQVMEVDKARGRFGLSIKALLPPPAEIPRSTTGSADRSGAHRTRGPVPAPQPVGAPSPPRRNPAAKAPVSPAVPAPTLDDLKKKFRRV